MKGAAVAAHDPVGEAVQRFRIEAWRLADQVDHLAVEREAADVGEAEGAAGAAGGETRDRRGLLGVDLGPVVAQEGFDGIVIQRPKREPCAARADRRQ